MHWMYTYNAESDARGTLQNLNTSDGATRPCLSAGLSSSLAPSSRLPPPFPCLCHCGLVLFSHPPCCLVYACGVTGNAPVLAGALPLPDQTTYTRAANEESFSGYKLHYKRRRPVPPAQGRGKLNRRRLGVNVCSARVGTVLPTMFNALVPSAHFVCCSTPSPIPSARPNSCTFGAFWLSCALPVFPPRIPATPQG